MVNKQYVGKELEIYEERAIYLANTDEMIFETMEEPFAEKKNNIENSYHSVFEEIELINNIEVSENMGFMNNIEVAEDLFSLKGFLNDPRNKIL